MAHNKYTEGDIPNMLSKLRKMNLLNDGKGEDAVSPALGATPEHEEDLEQDVTSPSLVKVQLEHSLAKIAQLTPLWSFDGTSFASARNRWRNPKVLFASVLCLLIVLGVGIYSAQGWLAGISTPAVGLYHIGNMQPVELSIGGGGIAFPRQQLDILYPVAERVISVMVKAGDHVSPNQPLLRLDLSSLNVDIQQAADDMAAAQNYLDSVSGNGNAVTIAQAQQAYEVAKNKYNSLLSQASSPMLHGGELISPMSGFVTQVNVNAGELFETSKPLLTIIDGSAVVLHAKIPLSYLGLVRTGQTVTVIPSALPNLTFQGTVSSIIPQADPQTDTFEVWVSVDNKNREEGSTLLPGMSAFAHIQSQTSALVVPRLAVLDPDGDAAVYVVRDQVAHLQRVQVIGRSVENIFINGGLTPGSQIALVGLDKLHDNQKVHIIPAD